MTEMFHKRMSEFEAQLRKAPSSSSSISEEFAAFRVLVTKSLSSLQSQIEILARNIDDLEMRGRRGILLLHGVAEGKDDNTSQTVVAIIRQNYSMDSFSEANIKRCHRLGRSAASKKTRPIMVKLRDIEVRNKIWYDKVKLKGTGITVSEFLTGPRHTLFMAARKRYGVSKCWTRNGTIYVVDGDGKRHRISSVADFEATIPENVPEASPAGPAITDKLVKTSVTRSKRIIQKK